jgi:putative mRNA 3-end processing factor
MTDSKNSASSDVLAVTPDGLYCAAGDFHIDPWRPVERAVITHAHSDHARWGCRRYLAPQAGVRLLRTRLGQDIDVTGAPWGKTVRSGDASVSFHPAGHILGSAQVRVEVAGQVWVVSGDYKTDPDPTCTAFEPIRCNTFVTESTFGLPIYRWKPQEETFAEVNAWWNKNKSEGRASVLCGYALGKAQRLLAGLDPSIGPIFTHGAVERLCVDYRQEGISLPATRSVFSATSKNDFAGAMIVGPPSVVGTPWLRRFGDFRLAFASGWMQIRGARRRRAVDRGFVLSDHADWPGLLDAIRATEATRVLVTHGYTGPLVRWLQEKGLEAKTLQTAYEGERIDVVEPDPIDEEPPVESEAT